MTKYSVREKKKKKTKWKKPTKKPFTANNRDGFSSISFHIEDPALYFSPIKHLLGENSEILSNHQKVKSYCMWAQNISVTPLTYELVVMENFFFTPLFVQSFLLPPLLYPLSS